MPPIHKQSSEFAQRDVLLKKHEPDYVEKLVEALRQLKLINDFSKHDMKLYFAAISAYESFIKNYLRDIFIALQIFPDEAFYKGDYFTCARSIAASAGDYGSSSTDEMQRDKVLFDVLSGYLKDNMDTFKQKLAHGQEVVGKLIPKNNLSEIIYGIHRLQWLLPTSDKVYWTELINFDSDYRSGQNAFVDFLLEITAKSGQLDQDEIRQTLIHQGTGKQQQTIAFLQQVCKNYLDHFTGKSYNNPNEQTSLLVWQKEIAQDRPKQQFVQALLTILLDDKKDIAVKIQEFKLKFQYSNEILQQFSDSSSKEFLKQVSSVFNNVKVTQYKGTLFTMNTGQDQSVQSYQTLNLK